MKDIREAVEVLSDLLWNHKSAEGDKRTERGLETAEKFLQDYLKRFPKGKVSWREFRVIEGGGMIEDIKYFRKRIRLEFKKFRFEPSKRPIKSFYEEDRELGSIQRLLSEWSLFKGEIQSLAKILRELGYETKNEKR